MYRVAGGAPVGLTSWNLYGGVQPYVTIDQWAIDNITDSHAHLRRAPADGTVVEGLPSHAFWVFSGGYRYASAATAGAVTQDDIGLGAFPVYVPSALDTVGPTIVARSTSGRRGHAIVLRYQITDNSNSLSQGTRIVVKNANRKVVKRYALGMQTMTAWHSVKWTCKARGVFRYYVYAKDQAGNSQVKVGSAKVVVR